jgi:hypothetical protein
MHQAGHRVQRDVVGLPVAMRAALAERRDPADDRARGKRVDVDAARFERIERPCVDDDVGAIEQFAQRCAGRRALAAVEPRAFLGRAGRSPSTRTTSAPKPASSFAQYAPATWPASSSTLMPSSPCTAVSLVVRPLRTDAL